MLLARQAHVLNDEKKKLVLTENIWYCPGEQAFLRGSRLSNIKRQEKGMCWFGWRFSKVQ